MRHLLQLPTDAKLIGCRQDGPFKFVQVFSSASADFEGTEEEFCRAGKAYAYIQIDRYTRQEIKL